MAILLIKQNVVISCCFVENRKEMCQQIFQRQCIAIVLFKKKIVRWRSRPRCDLLRARPSYAGDITEDGRFNSENESNVFRPP